MIKSFADELSYKIYLGRNLSKKERKQFGDLDFVKARKNLIVLDKANEKDLFLYPALHYHRLQGSARFSIDANARNSPWRITFEWEDEKLSHVEFVRIQDTH